MSVVNSTISSSNYEIFNELLPLTVDPILLWAANRKNVPTASPASGYQSDSDYSYGSSSPESEYGLGTISFLDALNSDLTETNTQPNVKGCLGGEELMSAIVPNFQDWSAFGPDQMPDTDFLLNLDDQVLKNTEENYPYNPTCLPNSPASSSSCDDGYGSDVLEISSIESGSPQPVEALPEEQAYSPQPEEVQVVPACPPQMQPEIKPTKPGSRTGRRKRGPRSLTLNNGNGPTQLWQFLLNLLTHGPKGLVQWTHDEPFEFKLLNPCAVATMWGKVKNKPSMNYEKLSRGLRYYYGKKILEKVHGKRYVYQFQCDIPKILGYDPTATDPKQNVEDAVCDSPDVADETSDIFEECPSSVSSEDISGECWEIGPGLW